MALLRNNKKVSTIKNKITKYSNGYLQLLYPDDMFMNRVFFLLLFFQPGFFFSYSYLASSIAVFFSIVSFKRLSE